MTESRPTRASTAGRIYLDLQNLARRTRRNTQDLLQMYALEGFLARLADSSYAQRLVLKGGVLLAAYDARRPTRDVDLQAQNVSGESEDVLAMICDIAARHADDGLVYDTAAATVSTIRDQDTYSGTRVRLEVALATAQIVINVDVNIGDPIWPAPQRIVMPGLLDRDLTLTGYPLSMVYAEKLVTMLERGLVNTRWRDFADVYTLSGRHPVGTEDLHASAVRVADHREVALTPLAGVLQGFAAIGQLRWAAWRRKQAADQVPEAFADTLFAVTAFADPVFTGLTPGGAWDPGVRRWG
ncbi:MAG: nucleotidyl transferase AbiEii/AbiGii toxin family protein [Micromonosporaceae bacterium]